MATQSLPAPVGKTKALDHFSSEELEKLRIIFAHPKGKEARNYVRECINITHQLLVERHGRLN